MSSNKLIEICGPSIFSEEVTLHAQALADNLQSNGIDAEYIAYPRYDLKPTGTRIKMAESGTVNLTEDEFQNDFYWNKRDFQPQILRRLNEGKVLVVENYTLQNIVRGIRNGMDKVWLQALNSDIVEPQISILLNKDIDPSLCPNKEGESSVNPEVLKWAKEKHIFLDLTNEYNINIVNLDSKRLGEKRTPEEISEEILGICLPVLK